MPKEKKGNLWELLMEQRIHPVNILYQKLVTIFLAEEAQQFGVWAGATMTNVIVTASNKSVFCQKLHKGQITVYVFAHTVGNLYYTFDFAGGYDRTTE